MIFPGRTSGPLGKGGLFLAPDDFLPPGMAGLFYVLFNRLGWQEGRRLFGGLQSQLPTKVVLAEVILGEQMAVTFLGIGQPGPQVVQFLAGLELACHLGSGRAYRNGNWNCRAEVVASHTIPTRSERHWRPRNPWAERIYPLLRHPVPRGCSAPFS